MRHPFTGVWHLCLVHEYSQLLIAASRCFPVGHWFDLLGLMFSVFFLVELLRYSNRYLYHLMI